MEQTLVFIKPDGVSRGIVGKVLSRFEDRGIQIKKMVMMTLTDSQIDAHYEEHLSKSFYPDLKTYIKSGPVVVMILEAPGVVAILRKMTGATNSAQAEPGTIRGDYALTTSHNILHASDSVENAAREIKNFFG